MVWFKLNQFTSLFKVHVNGALVMVSLGGIEAMAHTEGHSLTELTCTLLSLLRLQLEKIGNEKSRNSIYTHTMYKVYIYVCVPERGAYLPLIS